MLAYPNAAASILANLLSTYSKEARTLHTKHFSDMGVTDKRKSRRLLLLLQVRWRRCVFFVVADGPLDGADVEYGALDAAHCQRNRAKRHDKSPKQIRGGLHAAVSRMVLPAHQRGSHLTTSPGLPLRTRLPKQFA